jgi:hypothetical protein
MEETLTLGQVRKKLEDIFEVEFDSRNFLGTNYLIKWGKPYIHIQWGENMVNAYWVSAWARENGTAKENIIPASNQPDSFDGMVQKLSRILPRRTAPKQMELF